MSLIWGSFFLGFFHRMCRLCLRLLALPCPLAGHLFRAAGHTLEISLLLPQTEEDPKFLVSASFVIDLSLFPFTCRTSSLFLCFGTVALPVSNNSNNKQTTRLLTSHLATDELQLLSYCRSCCCCCCCWATRAAYKDHRSKTPKEFLICHLMDG